MKEICRVELTCIEVVRQGSGKVTLVTPSVVGLSWLQGSENGASDLPIRGRGVRWPSWVCFNFLDLLILLYVHECFACIYITLIPGACGGQGVFVYV